jgi:hypothetical protein
LPLLFLLNFIISLEKSIIYEKGVTNIKTSFLDKLFRKSFMPYEKIKKIAYDKKAGKIEYILFLDHNEKSSLGFMMYNSNIYQDNFLDELHQTLKNKCPNAKWIKIEKSKLRNFLNKNENKDK